MRDIIYSNTISGFRTDVDNGILTDKIINELKNNGIGVSSSQRRAFDESFPQMCLLLNPVNQDLNCAVEYVVFSSSKKRVDFMISGLDDDNKQNLLIFELKGWSEDKVKLLDYSQNLEANVANSKVEEVSHPSAQAFGYKKLFENYYSSVEDNLIDIHTASYLYHYKEYEGCPVKNEVFYSLLEESPVFLRGDNHKLREFINKYLKKSDNFKIFESLNSSEIRPSKKLKDNLKSIVLDNEHFQLFGAQEVVFNSIVAKVKWCIENNSKSVFIIKGGPGTGKSIVALKLLANMINTKDAKAFYISQNSAVRRMLTHAMKKASKNEKNGLDLLIKWSGEWVKEVRNNDDLDLVVVDEAHRLTTSAQGAREKGITIIDEIIKSSKVSVFFIDEDQIVTYKDKGTQKNIIDTARKYNIEPIMKEEFTLDSQFRCNGSDGYIAFIDYFIKGIKPERKSYKFEYDFKVFNSCDGMMTAIKEKYDSGLYARYIAGITYEWEITEENDYEIPPMKRNWNKDTQTWATRENSFNEIGCVFSAQGVEFDYAGVFIGKDLMYDEKTKTAIPVVENHSKGDHSYMSANFKKSKENLDNAKLFILNAYKVLLTRGINGCYVYAEDPNLCKYMNDLWIDFKKKYGE